MPHIARKIYVPYTIEQMFALVADIESYAHFLPYCLESHVLFEAGAQVEGAVRVGYKAMGYTFITHNTNQPPDSIHMSLSKGPFTRLEGEWRFIPTIPTGSHIEVEITVEFRHALMAMAFTHKMNEVADKVVDAFIERAKVLYG